MIRALPPSSGPQTIGIPMGGGALGSLDRSADEGGIGSSARRRSTGPRTKEGLAVAVISSAPPTVRDVARLAGVSAGTVSKVLNGRGQLREQTRARVQDAASKLGFRPNHLARSLIEGRTYTVGLLTSDRFGRFSMPLIEGIEDSLGAGRILTLLCDGRGDPLRERHYLRE